ncbi:transcriptional repressor LexA [Fluviispira sanaruensis]|uniref:Transcriptional repressor LexA n=1 Tax=Fluviispira sanaruensis TaxID=2493639 RepID=A0A4P2VII7_FLUSA|nr:transcriptional repressor LexA [Fluviispira sanaruensis]BBH52943.1 transcriptional repressor LexA [Fluviispira sanaruensis]
MLELTHVQRKVMEFILNHMDSTGTPPTIREIANYFQWKSVGSAQDVIAALRKKGLLLSPMPGKSRQLVPTAAVLDGIFNQYPAVNTLSHKSRFTSAKKKYLEKMNNSNVLPGFEDLLRVPMLGIVQAGNPHEAIENAGEFIIFPSVARNTLRDGKVFALNIEGYSMLNVGFLPKDIILVETIQTAHDRDIVVAYLNQGEVTVKRYAQKGSALYKLALKNISHKNPLPPAFLVPENPDFEPIPFGIDESDKIIGIVRSLYRKSVF